MGDIPRQAYPPTTPTTDSSIMRFLAVFLMVALVGGAQAWSLGSLWGAEEELTRKERDVEDVEHLKEDIEDEEDELEDDEDDDDDLEEDEDDEEDDLEDDDEDDEEEDEE